MSKTCTRRGCGKSFDPLAPSTPAECSFHPGAPVFHEGLKSWSCCQDGINKPVLHFDDFMQLNGCCTGSHSTEVQPLPEGHVAPAPPVKEATIVDGKESYGPASSAPSASTLAVPAPKKKEAVAEYVEIHDPAGATIAEGTKCRRRGCPAFYAAADGAAGRPDKDGEGEGEGCVYHPGAPIFHEGSKGYTCCRARVLTFDDFLSLPGCRSSRLHQFLDPPPAEGEAKKVEVVEARWDWYQTPGEVIISIFAKKADATTSLVSFTSTSFTPTLHLPSSSTYTKVFNTQHPISATGSKFKIWGTKCEVILEKEDKGRMWEGVEAAAAAEKDEEGLKEGQRMVWSATGKRGTMGAKEPELDMTNLQLKR